MRRVFGLLAVVMLFGALLAVPYPAQAASPMGCPQGPPGPVATTANYNCPEGGAVINGKYSANGKVSTASAKTPAASGGDCGGVKTSINYGCNTAAGGPIYSFARAIISFASGLVGLVVIIMLIVGGIRYITSAGDPKLVSSAKKQIANSMIGLVLFALMLAILNFLLPKGIIG